MTEEESTRIEIARLDAYIERLWTAVNGVQITARANADELREIKKKERRNSRKSVLEVFPPTEWELSEGVDGNGEVDFEALPCPFCGSRNLVMKCFGGQCWLIMCKICESEGPLDSLKKRAIERWNKAKR